MEAAPGFLHGSYFSAERGDSIMSQNILLGIFFNSRNTDTHINTYKGNRHIKRGMKGEIQFFILYFTELMIRVLLTSGLYAKLKLQVHDVAKINQNY